MTDFISDTNQQKKQSEKAIILVVIHCFNRIDRG